MFFNVKNSYDPFYFNFQLYFSNKIVLQFFSKHITPELPNRPHPERLGYKMPYKKIKYRQYVLPNIYRQNVLGVDVLQHFVSRHSVGIDVSWVDVPGDRRSVGRRFMDRSSFSCQKRKVFSPKNLYQLQ